MNNPKDAVIVNFASLARLCFPALSFRPARSPEELCFGVKNSMLHSNYLGSFGTPVFPPLLYRPAEFIASAISASFYSLCVLLLKLVVWHCMLIRISRAGYRGRQRYPREGRQNLAFCGRNGGDQVRMIGRLAHPEVAD